MSMCSTSPHPEHSSSSSDSQTLPKNGRWQVTHIWATASLMGLVSKWRLRELHPLYRGSLTRPSIPVALSAGVLPAAVGSCDNRLRSVRNGQPVEPNHDCMSLSMPNLRKPAGRDAPALGGPDSRRGGNN